MTKAELYQKACMLPLLPGVYIIRDKSDTIIYIGKAKRLRIRVNSKKTINDRPILIMFLPDGKDLITPHPSPR